MATLGLALVVLGTGYAVLSGAQFRVRAGLVLRKPGVAPTREQRRESATFGLVIGATAVLLGLWFLGIDAIGVALLALGVGYTGLCAAQFAGHVWFVVRKPAVAPSREQLRAGAAFGLVMAAFVILLGLWFLGVRVSGTAGFAVWIAFMVSCGVVAGTLRARRRKGGSPQP